MPHLFSFTERAFYDATFLSKVLVRFHWLSTGHRITPNCWEQLMYHKAGQYAALNQIVICLGRNKDCFHLKNTWETHTRWGDSRFTAVSRWNTEFILILLFINYFVIFLQTYFCSILLLHNPVYFPVKTQTISLKTCCVFAYQVQWSLEQHGH